MIRKTAFLFCDNEHGKGAVTFPDLEKMSDWAIEQEFIKESTATELRREAKKIGWGRVNGGDYCPQCMENM